MEEEKVVKPTPKDSGTKVESQESTEVSSEPKAEPVNESEVTDAETTVDKSGNVPEVERPDETDILDLIPQDPYYTDPLFYEVANFFGIQQEDYAVAKNKLSDIVEHVIREKRSNEPAVVLKALREIEDTIQPPAWGEKRYTNVHRYVRLATKKQTIRQAMSAFERKGNGN